MEYIFAVQIKFPEKFDKEVQEIKNQFNLFYGGNYDMHSHISLYICKFPNTDIKPVVEALSNENLNKINLKINNIREKKNKENSFIYIDVEKTQDLILAHEKVIKIANEYRDGLIRKKDVERLGKGLLTGLDAELTTKWGYRFVFENFDPHITLGQFPTNEREVGKLLHEINNTFSSAQVEFPIETLFVGLWENSDDEYKLIAQGDIHLV